MKPVFKWLSVGFLLLIVLLPLSGCRSQSALSNYEPAFKYEAYAQSLPVINPNDYLYLFDYDHQAPLDIQETRQWQENGSIWSDLTYASPLGERVPATLILPPGMGPFAGVILMQGMPSDRK